MHDIRSINYTSDPDEWFLLLEIPDMWRIVVPVPADVAADDARSEEYIKACLQNISPTEEDREILVKSGVSRAPAGGRHLPPRFGVPGRRLRPRQQPVGRHGTQRRHPRRTGAQRHVDQGVGRAAAAPEELDEYERVRRPVAINDISAQTERNKKMLEERDPVVRAENNRRLRETCADPDLAYQYALEVSMIRSLRDAGLLPRPAATAR